MAQRKKTFMDTRGISPETQDLVMADFNRKVGGPLQSIANRLMNRFVIGATIASTLVGFITYVAHHLGYLSEHYRLILTLSAVLPLYYLFTLIGLLAFARGFISGYMPLLKEDQRRNRRNPR